MADILHLGKKSAGLRPKADDSMEQVLGGADIIFFPGVRYERERALPTETGGQDNSPTEPSSTKCS